MEVLVGMGSFQSVVIHHEGGHRAYPDLVRLHILLLDHRSVPPFSQCRSQVSTVQSRLLGQGSQHDGRADVLVMDEVGAKYQMPQRIGLTLGFCPFGSLVRRGRVIPMGTHANFEACFLRQNLEIRLFTGTPITGRQLLTFGRNAGVELEGAPLDLKVVFGAQFVDPRLADVAERSNEIAKNDKLGRHRKCLRVQRQLAALRSAWPGALRPL
jgi:hypothetical protein